MNLKFVQGLLGIVVFTPFNSSWGSWKPKGWNLLRSTHSLLTHSHIWLLMLDLAETLPGTLGWNILHVASPCGLGFLQIWWLGSKDWLYHRGHLWRLRSASCILWSPSLSETAPSLLLLLAPAVLPLSLPHALLSAAQAHRMDELTPSVVLFRFSCPNKVIKVGNVNLTATGRKCQSQEFWAFQIPFSYQQKQVDLGTCS